MQMQPFECATIYLSGQEYATASCLPQLVKGLQWSIQQSHYDTSPGKAFLASAEKGITERWGRNIMSNNEPFQQRKITHLLLQMPFSQDFRKLKFMAAEDGTRVQGQLKSLLSKKQMRLGYMAVTQQQKQVNVLEQKPALDNHLQSDTDSLSEAEEEEIQVDQKIQMVRNEVQVYFTETAICKKDDPLK